MGRIVDLCTEVAASVVVAEVVLDPDGRALRLIRGLSIEDFGNPGLTFHPDGRITPLDRPPVTRRTFDDEISGIRGN